MVCACETATMTRAFWSYQLCLVLVTYRWG